MLQYSIQFLTKPRGVVTIWAGIFHVNVKWLQFFSRVYLILNYIWKSFVELYVERNTFKKCYRELKIFVNKAHAIFFKKILMAILMLYCLGLDKELWIKT